MEDYSKMFSCIGTMLDAVEEVQPPPLHSKLGEQWWDNVGIEWALLCNEAEEGKDFQAKGHSVLECFQIGYDCIQSILLKQEAQTSAHVQQLLSKPQSVQRTEEWYREMRVVLSASEFYKLFGTPRARGELVLSKIQAQEEMAPPRLSCLTMEMTALDWGIRFEPVAKMILESRWKAKIAEMGRLHHPTRKGLAASPDGLVTECEDPARVGDLIEIKCPSTREVGKGVPPNYWHQMQLQLEVASSPLCQYCEFTFRSYTAQQQTCKEPNEYSEKGNIFIVQNITSPRMHYEYSPVGDLEWRPTPLDGWEVIEIIPWYLEKLWIQPVLRDQAWFESIMPLIDNFWRDVEKAKVGEFQIPESSVKRKSAFCGIID